MDFLETWRAVKFNKLPLNVVQVITDKYMTNCYCKSKVLSFTKAVLFT